MRVTRRKASEPTLSDYPAWAIDVMMGLYGERQIAAALTAERPAPIDVAGSAEAADLDAVGSVFARLGRLRRRHP